MEGAREVLAERSTENRVRRAIRRIGLDTIARRRRLAIATRLTDLVVRSGLASVARRLGPRRMRWLSTLAARREGEPFALTQRGDADMCLFAGCVMREAFGETERATVRVLERDGRRVTAPIEQVCCGALHAHAGDGEQARALARRNIDAFSGTDLPVVVNAAGCGAHLKAYGDVLHADPTWARRGAAFAARVRDATEVARPQAGRVARQLRVVYQDACHLAHGQRIRAQPRALLRAIDGVTLLDIADAERCCGSAGIYNVTHPDLSRELQRQKVAAILEARPDVVVSANPGCILQVAAGLRAAGSNVPVVHVMRFLDDPAAFV
ncbi:MAG TPA: heterodisulfide reductase-related iron-sulfur binding cluster [Candidatus Limnocylindria bacterium]|nr:heterodisulfide reductase-related iron-sulfur binding cluster [Candidatus Limnocylindria bacterium]